ncbi:MAG: hypothetical protein IJL26_03150 [Clostridia bacterium]|nr:hypothetical protein [Clostridia bacterium]
MKALKKIFPALLAVLLAAVCAVPAFAERQEEPEYDVWISEGYFEYKLTKTEDGPALKTVYFSKALRGEDAYIPKTLAGIELTPELLPGSHINNYLTPFRVDDDNAYFSVIDGALCTKDGQTLISVPYYKIYGRYAVDSPILGGIYAVPEGIRTVAADSLWATDATCVVISDSVTRIDPASGVERAGAIAGRRGAEAERFAAENGVPFVSLGEDHAHVWFRVRNDATCVEDGETAAACPCGERTDAVTIPPRSGAHWYEYTDDTLSSFCCVYCGEEYRRNADADPSGCGCACHTLDKTRIQAGKRDVIAVLKGIVYRFRLILWRLTGTHRYCDCGARHY